METITPPKFTLKAVVQELQPTIKKMASEDEMLAKLADYPEWEVLKARIEEKIKYLENIVDNPEDIDDLELYGFKCMARNILADELKRIISDVAMTSEVMKKKNGRE